MSAPTRAVIFDLDGTLVQTRIASWEIFEQVNRRHGLGVDSPEEFFALFRGNIFASLAERCRDDAHVAEVKQEFLTLLRRDYSPPLVPGIRDVVRRLASECTLAVMSSNAMTVLRRVLTDNDIAYCFAHVFGGDVAPDKRAAIRAFLADSGSAFGRRCAADYDEGNRGCAPDPSSTVLVTDTAGDVRDAREVGIRVVGVTWGCTRPTSSSTPGPSSSRCGRRRSGRTCSATSPHAPRPAPAPSRPPARPRPPCRHPARPRRPCRRRPDGRDPPAPPPRRVSLGPMIMPGPPGRRGGIDAVRPRAVGRTRPRRPRHGRTGPGDRIEASTSARPPGRRQRPAHPTSYSPRSG